MQLTDRFLDFADQQLNPVVSLMGFTHLGLYCEVEEPIS
jgi:hypothetical protein